MKRAYRIETVQGILHLQKKLHLYSQALKKKKIQNRINWVLVKALLFLFKELPHACNLPISNIVSALFWGGRRRKAVLRAFPWITGTIPAGHLQQTGISSHRERTELSLFNYTSQLGSVMRGSPMNILQACSQQNRRVLPTQHYFPWHLVGEEGKKSKITTYTHLSIWNRCWGEVYYAAEN